MITVALIDDHLIVRSGFAQLLGLEPDLQVVAEFGSGREACISPAKFHECFINWMRDCHTSDDKDVIAIDGKTLRHSYDKSRRRGAIHVISAFSTMHSLVIGQIKTDEKSNEITAIPELLNMLDIKGKIITTDAMGCQKDIAEKIQKQGGDYLYTAIAGHAIAAGAILVTNNTREFERVPDLVLEDWVK